MLPVARFRRISARFFLFSPFRATELAINGGKEPRKERQGGTKGPWGSGSLERGWVALSSGVFYRTRSRSINRRRLIKRWNQNEINEREKRASSFFRVFFFPPFLKFFPDSSCSDRSEPRVTTSDNRPTPTRCESYRATWTSPWNPFPGTRPFRSRSST